MKPARVLMLVLLGFLNIANKHPRAYAEQESKYAKLQSCLVGCEGGCYQRQNPDLYCQDRQAACELRCIEGKRWWGAIAYSSKDRAWGYSRDFNTEKEARRVALENCQKQRGVKCVLEMSFEDLCGAVAADGPIVGWGTAYDRGAASRRAVSECQKASGKKCLVEAWACSKMTL